MKTQELWCENGAHTWEREAKRGRRPTSCPEHPEPIEGVEVAPKELSPALEAAHRARSQKRYQEVWEAVTSSTDYPRCKCDLHEGMSLNELRALGVGCTYPNYVCPTLDKYRRLLS